MPAPKGNQFWKARSSHGRKPVFADPEQLWEASIDYFEWVEDNPLFASELITHQGNASSVAIRKMRAMTITGLCEHLGIGRKTWADYRGGKTFRQSQRA